MPRNRKKLFKLVLETIMTNRVSADRKYPPLPPIKPCYCKGESKICDGVCIDWKNVGRFKNCLNKVTDKSIKTRCECLEDMHKYLCANFVSEEFLLDQKHTLLEVFERILLRKSEPEEKKAAIILLRSLAITLDLECDDFFNPVKISLLELIADHTQPISLRAECATTLGIFCFVLDDYCLCRQAIMDALYNVFKGSFYDELGDIPTIDQEMALFHTKALESWTLLLTILPDIHVSAYRDEYFERIPELLDSGSLELTIAAGEAIAVIYEVSLHDDPHFRGLEIHHQLLPKLMELAHNNTKQYSKKDYKEQKSHFQCILKFIEDKTFDTVEKTIQDISFKLDSWCLSHIYMSMAQVLGNGIQKHLERNVSLRDLFELGDTLENEETNKQCRNMRDPMYRIIHGLDPLQSGPYFNEKLNKRVNHKIPARNRTLDRQDSRDIKADFD